MATAENNKNMCLRPLQEPLATSRPGMREDFKIINHSHRQPHILIVDDDREMLTLLGKVIGRKCKCELTLASSGREAAEVLKQDLPEVILTDVKMPDMDGITLMTLARELDPTISVIIMTGFGTIELAVSAMKEGAYDFLQKPFDNDYLVHVIRRSIERTLLLRENRRLQKKIEDQEAFHGLVGQSPRIRRVFDLISKIADTDVTVLIRGESGTGKELAARALHELSSRSSRPMVAVNCPALPEHILESELFGYVKGAFTGAVKDKKGLFLEADGSTILLDEIADIPLSIQTKLLRVLQAKEIRPLGSTQSIKINVRVLASTNQDLESKIREGSFREDLFYRLNVITVVMPPLREIQEDIAFLAYHFLRLYAKEYERNVTEFTPRAIKCLERRQWNGNVRELQNTIKRAVLLSSGNTIDLSDIYANGEGAEKEITWQHIPCFEQLSYNKAKIQVVSLFTRNYIRRALEKTMGNVTEAANISGIERQAFQRLMRRYGIKSEEFRSKDKS
ncbi:sigma-54-dependent transcriptional regulator [Dissulfurimicrobium hydrothermale]|uniref:sigma-54-dependent transcriptional regulator n=1 Tax=Dissulfurimicrobium hydrothermale TaxID=1750598 RepID=UPI001ED9E5F5|nr:sigma-54 dependent transcriptional regulator [Dissulfurimicrobium hydrothermale]UKL13631.1 sigma-54 dependent transcriptional regulator [Dissulfurimicrobium hydrothermale]